MKIRIPQGKMAVVMKKKMGEKIEEENRITLLKFPLM